MYFRLIKPDWAKRTKKNGEPNPEFEQEIDGADTYEGFFEDKYLKKMNKKGYNIYYFPNYPSKAPEKGEYLSGKHIDNFKCVFVDMDLKDRKYESKEAFIKTIKSFPLTPNRIVDSGNGIHVYWNISDLTREAYIELQFRLIQFFHTDDSVWTPLQLMRMPGYMNTKKFEGYKEAKILEEHDKDYTVSELSEHLPAITDQNKSKLQIHIAKIEGTWKPQEYDIDSEDLPDVFNKLCETNKTAMQLFTDPRKAYKDRSGADMKLCNLLYSVGFERSDAYRVMINTQKALSRSDREDYALNIVEKVFSDRSEQVRARSVSELEAAGDLGQEGVRIYGPDFWDCTAWGWRRGEVMGIIAGTGVGKTALSLVALYHFIKRPENKGKNYIHFFFSLEMPARQIIKRWKKLCGDDKECFETLYVIDNRDKNSRIGWQEVYIKVKDTCRALGKEAGCVIVDHMRALSNRINLKQKPHFDVLASQETGFYGEVKTATEKDMCRIMDDLAEMLNCFLIVQNQSSKMTAEEGDVPMGVNSAYGTTFFSWHCDYIITVWQPLKRVQNMTDLTVTGWQYCKIREQDEADGTKTYKKHVLFYDQSTGNLRRLTEVELEEFRMYLTKAIELRKEEKKNNGYAKSYDDSPGMTKATPALRLLKQLSDDD